MAREFSGGGGYGVLIREKLYSALVRYGSKLKTISPLNGSSCLVSFSVRMYVLQWGRLYQPARHGPSLTCDTVTRRSDTCRQTRPPGVTSGHLSLSGLQLRPRCAYEAAHKGRRLARVGPPRLGTKVCRPRKAAGSSQWWVWSPSSAPRAWLMKRADPMAEAGSGSQATGAENGLGMSEWHRLVCMCGGGGGGYQTCQTAASMFITRAGEI